MWHLQVLLGSGALVVVLLVLDVARALGWRRPPLYRLPPHWLDPSERALLTVLEAILGDSYRYVHRVRVAEVLELAPQLRRRERERAAAHLERYRFDLLICERQTLRPCCAINLTPRRWWRTKTPPRDGLDRLCRAVGLPVLRLFEQPHYNVAEIEARLRAVLPKPIPTAGLLALAPPPLPDDEQELAALRELVQVMRE